MKLAKSLFISSEIQEKEVTLPNGETHKLHFKQMSFIEFRKFQLAESSNDEDVKAASMAKLIAASIVDPDGKPGLTLKEAMSLTTGATMAIFNAILSINGYGEQKKD